MKIEDNPFYILNCSPETTKEEIIECSEIKSLEIDEELCKEAENVLLSPQKRLEAEVGWFFSFSSDQISQRLKQIKTDFKSYILDLLMYKTKLSLAEANFLAYGFDNINYINNKLDNEDIRLAVSILCSLIEKFSLNEIKNYIEKSRLIAKIPNNISIEELKFFIDKQKSYYRSSFISFIKDMDIFDKNDIFIQMINEATNFGKNTCKWSFLEDLIYDYEFDIKDIIEGELQLISIHIEDVKSLFPQCPNIDEKLEENYNIIVKIIEAFASITKPIVLFKYSRGINDENSEKLFFKVRDLSLFLTNKYDKYSFSLRLTKQFINHFEKVRSIMEIASNDNLQLGSLIHHAEAGN